MLEIEAFAQKFGLCEIVNLKKTGVDSGKCLSHIQGE